MFNSATAAQHLVLSVIKTPVEVWIDSTDRNRAAAIEWGCGKSIIYGFEGNN